MVYRRPEVTLLHTTKLMRNSFPMLIGNRTHFFAMQKGGFYVVERWFLPCKTGSFGTQKSLFCNALILNTLHKRVFVVK